MDYYEEKIVSEFTGKPRTTFGGFGFDKYKLGERVDPRYQAAYNLNKTLEKYPEFTKEARMDIQNEFVNFPDIAVVNLEAIASVLNFLKLYPDPKPEHFRDEIIVEYFSRLIPDKKLTEEQRAKLIIRLKAQFLKYIVAIKVFREGDEIEDEEEE